MKTDAYVYDALRELSRSAEAAKKERIAMGNRAMGHAMRAAGLDPLSKNADKDRHGPPALKKLMVDYSHVMQSAVEKHPETNLHRPIELRVQRVMKLINTSPPPNGLMTEYSDFIIAAQYAMAMQAERDGELTLRRVIKDVPIWREFLQHVDGVGPALAASIICRIDIHKAQYPSSLWRYAGYDVGPDGKGRSKRAEHLEEVEYVDRDGVVSKRRGITFNPQLKTQLYLCTEQWAKLKARRDTSPYVATLFDTRHRLAGTREQDGCDEPVRRG